MGSAGRLGGRFRESFMAMAGLGVLLCIPWSAFGQTATLVIEPPARGAEIVPSPYQSDSTFSTPRPSISGDLGAVGRSNRRPLRSENWTEPARTSVGLQDPTLTFPSAVDDDPYSRAETPASEYPLEVLSPEMVFQQEGVPEWIESVRVGYDGGFVIADERESDLQSSDLPFRMRINGWGHLRHAILNSNGPNEDLNQIQLKRARVILSGHAFIPEFSYFIQLDGRSTAGDDFRLLDYALTYDFGSHQWNCEPGTIGFRTGKYKIPTSLARYLSGRELEFSDRSMGSIFFDVNRSLAWGLYGSLPRTAFPIEWETAVFNGLVTGGAETGSSGSLDNNFAYSVRVLAYPNGEWGAGELADFDFHEQLATRMCASMAFSTIDRLGATEFDRVRVVDSGERLASLIPGIDSYRVAIYTAASSFKYRGWSGTCEYYLRNISGFQGTPALPDLFDHGHWIQLGYFAIPDRLQLISRWSRVTGNSGVLGDGEESSDEISSGFVWYFNRQNARVTLDFTHLNGAPIDSSVLDIRQGDSGFLVRSQIQFAF